MSPSPFLSAHMCKQIYKSFQNNRQTTSSPPPEPTMATTTFSSPPPPPPSTATIPALSSRRSPSPEKRSMDSDRSSDSSSAGMKRSPSDSSWTSWGGR